MIFLPELTTLTEVCDHHAATRPDHPAVRTPRATVTYGELGAGSDAAAAGLAALGAGPGDRIAYVGPEHEGYWEALFACAKLGAVLVPVNWRLTAEEVRHIIADSGAAVLIIDPSHPMSGRSGIREVPADHDGWRAWCDGHAGARVARADADEDTPVAQIYTSGTTGLPKGVVLAHRSWFKVRDALGTSGVGWYGFEEGDACLVAIPGFHVGGMWYATHAFAAGQTVVSLPELTPETVHRAIAGGGVTHAIMVPALMAAVATRPDADPADFRDLRAVIYGGAPIGDAVLEQCRTMLGAELSQIYGLTETGNTCCCLPPHEHVPGSPRLRAAGRPYPGFAAKIAGDDGAELPRGDVGEVWLRTPARMIGYWNMPEATAQTLVDGWIRTGDAGYMDDEGYVYLHDRYKDLILVGGENVFPAEVERALTRHPGVADAAVIGVPDDIAGEAVLAFVAPAGAAAPSTRDLVLFLRDHLAPFKLPTRWEFVDSIPRNPSGKILRRTLRERYWAGRDRLVN